LKPFEAAYKVLSSTCATETTPPESVIAPVAIRYSGGLSPEASMERERAKGKPREEPVITLVSDKK
jgi:hypothetical protein